MRCLRHGNARDTEGSGRSRDRSDAIWAAGASQNSSRSTLQVILPNARWTSEGRIFLPRLVPAPPVCGDGKLSCWSCHDIRASAGDAVSVRGPPRQSRQSAYVNLHTNVVVRKPNADADVVRQLSGRLWTMSGVRRIGDREIAVALGHTLALTYFEDRPQRQPTVALSRLNQSRSKQCAPSPSEAALPETVRGADNSRSRTPI